MKTVDTLLDLLSKTPPGCIVCRSAPAELRTPTYDDRKTGKRYALTAIPVLLCFGCTYDAANAHGTYVDERG